MVRKTLSDYPNRVRFWRDHSNLKQEDLGKLVELSKVQISRIELGARDLKFGDARKIAGALGVSTADLMSQSDNPLSADVSFHQITRNYFASSEEGKATILALSISTAAYNNGQKTS